MHWAPLSSHALIDEGALDWYRVQSVFALVRGHGGSEALAWTVQAIVSLMLAVGLIWLWRSRVAFELKAAALAAGALLATPYLFMYDLVVLAVAVAFLLRLALARDFLSRMEIAALAVAGALILIYPYVKTHVGLAAVVIVMAVVVGSHPRRIHSAGIATGTSAPTALRICHLAITRPAWRAATIDSTATAMPAMTSIR